MKCKNCKFLGILEDEDGKEYEWCEKVLDNPDVDMERECRHFERARNVDLVRSALIEDLASFLLSLRGGCRGITNGTYMCYDPNRNCKKCWLEWLRREADE